MRSAVGEERVYAALPPGDPELLRRAHGAMAPVVERYFRHEVRGGEKLPGRQTLIVSHHDGGLIPVNAVCFVWDWHRRFDFGRPLYTLTHDILHTFSRRLGGFLAGCGAVRADRAMMDAALATGASVLVFPGAARETFRPFWHRDTIDLGGRSGFIAQAIRWGIPITPVVSAGGHETLFVLAGGHDLARRIGIPKLVRSADVLPLVAGLPWGLWAVPFLPPIPLPAKITTEVLEPIWLPDVIGRGLKPSDADDPAVVAEGFRVVLERMQSALKRLYAERRWPVVG